jgi:hypothetical protein
MIYIVSGYMRTGTSMMMQALIAGGMPADWEEKRDAIADSKADELYHPNPGGLREVALKEYRRPDFPLNHQGKLIKVMMWGLDNLRVNPAGYRVILMERHPEEIRQSYEAFFGRPHRSYQWLTQYRVLLERAQEMLLNRRDVVDTFHFQYKEVVSKPRSIFVSLEQAGWPIDPGCAAAVVDENQYRFRLEKLTYGI